MAANRVLVQSIFATSLLVMLAGFARAGADLSQCNYDHLSKQKMISKTEKDQRLEFDRQFQECIPLFGKWADEAVKRMDSEVKRSLVDYHNLQRDFVDPDKPLFIMMSEKVKDADSLADIACYRQKFYSEIFTVQLDRLCSGIDKVLKDISLIYELVTGDGESSGLDDIERVKLFYHNSTPTTFEWVTYTRSCDILNEYKKYISEQVRRLFLKRDTEEKNWLSKVQRLLSKNSHGECDDPDDAEYESLN